MASDKSNRVTEDIEMGVIKTDKPLLAEWTVDIEARARNSISREEQIPNTTTIYKVPSFLRDRNPKAFTPQFVSFGPFHHDNPEVKAMEFHKERALVQFIKRANKPFPDIVNEVAKIITALRDVYYCLDDRWKIEDEEFLKMMIVDGCFMFELLQFVAGSRTRRSYSDTDPYFSLHAINHKFPFIRKDMLVIENQLPLFLLRALLPFQTLDHMEFEDEDHYINALVYNFVTGYIDRTVCRTTLGLHVLDLFRKTLISPEPRTPVKHPSELLLSLTADAGWGAVELDKAGVSFKRRKTKSVKAVHFNFETGKLYLPRLIVDASTEYNFLSIIAFEHLHVNVNHDVTSYICFMEEIIRSASDVSLLRDRGIVMNFLGSDEAVVGLFNRIGKEVTVDPDSSLMVVRREVYVYCRKMRTRLRVKIKRWIADLINTYFSSPWSALSLAGALLLLGLTIIQTVYTIRK